MKKNELRQKIKELKEEGLKRKQIAEKLNIKYANVSYFLNSKEPKSHGEKYQNILEDSKTLRQCEIVKKYNVSRQYVSWVIQNGNKKN